MEGRNEGALNERGKTEESGAGTCLPHSLRTMDHNLKTHTHVLFSLVYFFSKYLFFVLFFIFLNVSLLWTV